MKNITLKKKMTEIIEMCPNKSMEEYIKVDATTNLEILCTCPYCGALEDVLDDVRECLRDELSASDIDQEVTCSECNKVFIIDNVHY